MSVYALDPLEDSRWGGLAASHPSSSPFHQTGWLKALRATYGYRPFVLTTTPPGEPLKDGIAMCEVRSWLTGSRLVSLPFSDHTQPFLEGVHQLSEILHALVADQPHHGHHYIELRPMDCEAYAAAGFVPSRLFWLHTLDLAPPLERIFKGLHRDCMQRRILHADRARLSYERGNRDALLREFYRLLLLTRRRQFVVPQPLAWFRNLCGSMGNALEIRVLRKDEVAVAAILTLRHGNSVVYKYGCSDENFHHLAAIPLLFWRLIEESKGAGAELIDLGRTEPGNEGLTRFKDRLGTTRRQIVYFQYPHTTVAQRGIIRSILPRFGRVLSCLPESLSTHMGTVLYRHFA